MPLILTVYFFFSVCSVCLRQPGQYFLQRQLLAARSSAAACSCSRPSPCRRGTRFPLSSCFSPSEVSSSGLGSLANASLYPLSGRFGNGESCRKPCQAMGRQDAAAVRDSITQHPPSGCVDRNQHAARACGRRGLGGVSMPQVVWLQSLMPLRTDGPPSGHWHPMCFR